jgi:predicted nucleic acid-binding protein
MSEEQVKNGADKTKYLIDTDVMINHLRKRRDTLIKLSDKKDIILSTSVLNKFELFCGINNAMDKENVEDLIRYFDICDVTEQIADKAAQIAQIKNISAGPLDILIAATCIINKLILVTHNIKHFKSIPDIKVYGQ